MITGLWTLKKKKVFAFTATSANTYERFTKNCIGMFETLEFKSEYEGKTYYFCSADCIQKFDNNPKKYIS